MKILKIEKLSKIYGKGDAEVIALNDISFEVEEGEFIAITGPSGSGKSTLLHTIAGLEKPSSGTVYFYNKDIYKMNKKGNNTEQICKIDTNIQYINMQDDAIYYTVTEDYEDSTIKYIKYNGTDKTTIKKTEYATNINVVKDWVIFLGMDDDYNSLMKMISIDGEEEKDL